MASEMISTVSPVFHGWETRIDNHTELAKLFVSTEDFYVFNSLIASELVHGIDHVATFYKVIKASDATGIEVEEVLDRLKDIEVTSIKWGHSTLETFVKRVEALKKEEKNEKHWKTVIDTASDDAKRITIQLIENGAVAAKTIISKIPVEARGAATDIFNACWPSVIAFFGKVWTLVKMVVAALEQFLQGTWSELEQALNATNTAAEIAMNLTCKVFKSSYLGADFHHFGKINTGL